MGGDVARRASRVQRIGWLAGALVAAGVIGGGFSLLGARTAREAKRADEPVTVEARPARLSEGYTVSRAYTGRLEARRRSGVGFELAGKVIEVAADDGDLVEAGQVLARLDTERLEARRAELVAARREAAARAELASATHRRVSNAFERNAASEQELDDAEDARDAAEAALERAERAVGSIDVEIEKSTIRAPYDAVVARRLVDEGQVVGAGAPVLNLLEREGPEARIGVAPALAADLRPGERVEARVGEEAIEGVIRDLLPVTDRGTRTVEVVVALEASLDGLRQGDLVTVEFERRIDEAGFWLPLDALTASARGLWACFVAAPTEGDDRGGAAHRVERRQLEALHTDGRRAYVAGALREGDLVILGGLHRIVAGDPVTLRTDGDGP